MTESTSKGSRRLSKFKTRAACNRGIWIDLRDPSTGEKTEGRIHIVGTDSDRWRDALDDAGRGHLDRLEKIRRLKGTPDEMSQEEIQDEERRMNLDCAAHLVDDWNLTDDNDQPIACTVENVVELFLEAPWIKRLVDETAGRRSAFLANRSSASSTTPSSDSASTESQADPTARMPTT